MVSETNPIFLPPLCCYDSHAAPFGRYVLEMLYAEGLTGAEEHDVRQMPLTADALRSRQAVIVAPCGEDTGAEEAALEALRQGTPVVFLRPSAETAAELGISDKQRRTANEAYIAPERDHPLWFAAVGDFLQFHGTADMYAEFGGRERVLAWIAGRDGPCRIRRLSPAAMARGALPSLHTTSQRPRCSSTKAAATKPAPARIPMLTATACFRRATSSSATATARCSICLKRLAAAIACAGTRMASAPHAPLARLWYYPDAAPAIVLFNGDSDGMTRPQMEWYTNMVEAHGGEYTVYLMEQHLPHLTPEMERDYRRRGHSAGTPHLAFTQADRGTDAHAHTRGGRTLRGALRLSRLRPRATTASSGRAGWKPPRHWPTPVSGWIRTSGRATTCNTAT